MSYDGDTANKCRRAGLFTDKILKGAKPADTPFEQPARYYFGIGRQCIVTICFATDSVSTGV